MTVEEYIANPESWTPTFVCDTNAKLIWWITNYSGENYRRVKVVGNLSYSGGGLNLTTSNTMQVVFAAGAKITFSNVPNTGAGIKYATRPTSNEYWMYRANIEVTGAGLHVNGISGLSSCANLVEPTVTCTGGSTTSVQGPAHGIEWCSNIVSPTVVCRGGSGQNIPASTGGGAAGLSWCMNIESPNVTVFGGSSGSSGGGIGGPAHGIRWCSNIVSPTVVCTGGTSSYGTGAAYGLSQVAQIHGYNSANITAATAKLTPAYWLSEFSGFENPAKNQPLTITWDFLDLNDEHPVKSTTLAVSYDNGSSWTNLYTGTNKTHTFTPSGTADSMLLRIKDPESWEIVSDTMPLVSDALPVISGADEAIGTFAAQFPPYSYQFERHPSASVEWTDATVTERIDNVIARSFSGQINSPYQVSVNQLVWRKILNGSHTLRIDVSNAYGTSSRALTFIKNEDTIRFKMAEPATSAARPEQIEIPPLSGAFPLGSTLQIEVCNNGLDDPPAWEDATADYLAGQPHEFINQEKTAAQWGINIRVTITRGTAPPNNPVNVDEVLAEWE